MIGNISIIMFITLVVGAIIILGLVMLSKTNIGEAMAQMGDMVINQVIWILMIITVLFIAPIIISNWKGRRIYLSIAGEDDSAIEEKEERCDGYLNRAILLCNTFMIVNLLFMSMVYQEMTDGAIIFLVLFLVGIFFCRQYGNEHYTLY